MVKIIVADDEPHHLDLVTTILTRDGHEVIGVQSGADCLDHLGREDFALLVVDAFMPGVDGFHVLAALNDRGYKLPVVGMTGGVKGRIKPFRDIMLRLGAGRVLAKPFTSADLRDAVNEALIPISPALPS